MPDRFWKAIESRREVSLAVRNFEEKFSKSGDEMAWFGSGRTVHHPDLGVWGHFRQSGQRAPESYWNVFGQHPARPRSNILVEINPPTSGRSLGRQGVIASDENGHRWLMHQGRLHPAGIRITEEMFDAVANPARKLVRYLDGSEAECIPVVDIDGSPMSVKLSMAKFVETCATVRAQYQMAGQDAALIASVSPTADTLKPELRGSYDLPPLGPRKANRIHGEIWAALDRVLEKAGAHRSNGRFGRLGPDLFARGAGGPVLFEIKPDAAAASIHTALGQLILYEHLSGQKCRKVMVLPSIPPAAVSEALAASGIAVLTYTQAGKSYRFAPETVATLLT